jgi:hypothetical protein
MQKPAQKQGEACLTCYGTGEAATDSGPETCPDCFGEGKAVGHGAHGAKLEWRLRAIEKAYRLAESETRADLQWLVNELRSTREALVHILARCQDAGESDTLAQDVKYRANEALGIYDPS